MTYKAVRIHILAASLIQVNTCCLMLHIAVREHVYVSFRVYLNVTGTLDFQQVLSPVVRNLCAVLKRYCPDVLLMNYWLVLVVIDCAKYYTGF